MTSTGTLTHPADRKFARFQLTGSTRALGAVYDIVSPELQRVALHLCGDPLDAEDLVQRTFLTAIERAQSFRRGKRVLPWLLGILAQHARTEKRRHGRVIDPLKLHLREGLDPEGAAQEAELDEHIERALAALPEEQRSVLTLRLRHGFSAVQIADALGRPPGTVRSQLARGLERLRSALPAGVVSAALAGLGLSSGMEALRAELLAKASAGALSKAVAVKGLLAWYLAPLAEIALMKKIVAAGVVVLGSLAALQLATHKRALVPEEALTVGLAEEVLLDPILEVAEERSRTNAAPGAKAGEAQVPAQAGAEPATGALLIRVRDSKGAPVAGELCRLRSSATGFGAPNSLAVSTDASGEVLVPELPSGVVSVQLLRGPKRNTIIEVGARQLLEIDLPRGIEVRVSVVDGQGDPVAGAYVWLSERWQVKRGHTVGRSDERGELLLQDVSPDNYVGAFAPGFGISYLQEPRARVGESTVVRIVLDTPGGSVEVHVVDQAGKALESAEVFVGRNGVESFRKLPDGYSGPAPPPRRGLTDGLGRLVLSSVPAGEQQVMVRMEGHGLGRTSLGVIARIPNQLRVMLSAEARVVGRVLGADGEPLKYASIWSGERHSFASSRALTDKDGRYSLGGLVGGEHSLQAARAGNGGGAGQVTLVLSPGEEREVDLRLVDRPQIIGSLTDSDGRSLRGYTLVATGKMRPGLSHTSTTDEGGEFSITTGEADDVYRLLVRRRGDWRSFPLLVVHDVRASAYPLELQLAEEAEMGAGIRLSVLIPSGELVDGARLELWHKQLRIWRAYNQSDGEIEALGIALGTVQLTLQHPDHPTKALGDFELVAGETLELGNQFFDPSGSLRGTLLGVDDPDLLATLAIHISQVGGSNGRISRSGTLIKSRALRVGSHQISILGDFIKPVYRSLEIVEGQELAIDIRLGRAGLRRISVTSNAGQAYPQWVAAQALDVQGRVAWSGVAQKQDDGSFELRISVEPGAYTLELNSSVGRTMSASFRVVDWSGNQAPLRITL